jgi:hypothetical protein
MAPSWPDERRGLSREVSGYLAYGAHGAERRFRGDRDRDEVSGGLRPDLRQRARASASFASTARRA